MYVVEGWECIPILLTLEQMVFGATTKNLIKVIVASLLSYRNLFDIDLTSKLINFGVDGMLIFQGAKINVIIKSKEKYAPFMLRVYCVAHRTNLIVHTFSKLLLVSKIEALLQFMYNCNHVIMTFTANVDATMMFFSFGCQPILEASCIQS
jgi:hypothetical protein